MESDELKKIEARARLAYETTRAVRAAVAFAPILLLATAAALIGDRLGYALTFGSALFVLGVALLWYGRNLKRAVLPGVLAGMVPLLFALCAMHVGRACMGDGWLTVCVPACVAGGIVAGILIDLVCLRAAHRSAVWLAASGIVLLTGAMGCSCAGVLGLLGLAIGFAVSAVPGFVAAMLRRRTSL
jgi:hypothetical protein